MLSKTSLLFLSPYVTLAITLTKNSMAERADTKCKPLTNNLCKPDASYDTKTLLITGIGGSGTNSVSRLFQLNNIDLPHETTGFFGSVSWAYAVNASHSTPSSWHGEPFDSSSELLERCIEFDANGIKRDKFNHSNPRSCWQCLPNLRTPRYGFNHVFHLVRCPRDVISSLKSHGICALRYMAESLKLDIPDEELTSTKSLLKLWLHWNEHVQSYSGMRFRIDQLKEIFTEGWCSLGMTKRRCLQNLTLPADMLNHRPHSNLTWAQLRAADEDLTQQVMAKAKEYGFPDSCFDDNPEVLSFEQPPISASQVLTVGIPPTASFLQTSNTYTSDVDPILWVWEKSEAERIFRPTDVFQSVREALKHLNFARQSLASKEF